jgi:acetoacetate decarboxylase
MIPGRNHDHRSYAMKKNGSMQNIPSFPFDSGSKTIRALLSRFAALARMKVKLWENAYFLLFDLPLDPHAAQKILPPGMWLRKPYRATFFMADYTKTAFTVPYHECALLIHVRTLFGSGVYCPWMIVDDDTALIYGRELLGYPKKMGAFNYARNEKTISAELARRGVQVFTVSGKQGVAEKKPAPVLGMKTFNFGAMGQWVAFNPVWLFKPNERIHESYGAEAELIMQDSVCDPIKPLIAAYTNPLPARVARIDILGTRIMLPVGITGLRTYANTFELRFR